MTEDPPPEGRATQGTHTGHTQTYDGQYYLHIVGFNPGAGRRSFGRVAPRKLACRTS